jgi:hypothetical protein
MDKMYAIMKNGDKREIDTKFMFNNQYNTVDGNRIYDREIQRIINDHRIGLYCCSKKQGTYDECLEAIKEERSKINQCGTWYEKKCYWLRLGNRVEDECYRKHYDTEDGVVFEEKTVYKVRCGYGNRCVHDIEETPRLFTEVQDCFFVQYPNGVPDNTDFVNWLIENRETTGFRPYFRTSTDHFEYQKKLGSYSLECRVSNYYMHFELSNCRDAVRFNYDFANGKFIVDDGMSYKVMDRLCKRYSNELVTCWAKFISLWNNLIEQYKEAEQNDSTRAE